MTADKRPSPPHIVVVDDDHHVRDLIRTCIETEGYRVSEAASGTELMEILQREPVNLVTLDLTLRNEDGLEVARSVQRRRHIPIIMITGKGEPIDRIVGLEIGADDYIAKPFHVREVLARIRSVLRRHSGSVETAEAPAGKRRFDGWVLDTRLRELRCPKGKELSLTESEFDLLEIFLANPNRVLSRDEIVERTKGSPWHGNDRLVDNQVNRLKRKMASAHDIKGMIRTVRNAGYIFTANVTDSRD